MGDYHNHAVPLFDCKDCLGQSLLASGVQIRVRFIQNNEERITIKRAGQSDALPLSCRKRRAAFADLGLIPARQAQDHFVHSRGLGRRDNGCRIGRRIKAGNVLSNGACEKFDILRQVADMSPQCLSRPLFHGGAVQADFAARCRPDADERPRQRRFTRCTRTDDTERGAGTQRKTQRPVRQNGVRLAERR